MVENTDRGREYFHMTFTFTSQRNKWRVFKEATSRGFRGLVGKESHAKHYLRTRAINIDFFFHDARKQVEKFNLNFSSFNPFPSWPSVAKDTRLHFQCTNITIVDKNRKLLLFFHDTNVYFGCSSRGPGPWVVLETSGTVSLYTDRPRPVNNTYISTCCKICTQSKIFLALNIEPTSYKWDEDKEDHTY